MRRYLSSEIYLLHNNAEVNGIRAGFVEIDLVGREPHALNVFNTTDRGIVFVDCTGIDDRKVSLKEQEKFLGSYFWDSLGIVEDIEIYW
ncbi:MAG TPA: hypothetical protein EYP30_01960 [Archaeoglobaceae archaeon]|nr:hypothetical protein [Archaeoglobaceae archaeon]